MFVAMNRFVTNEGRGADFEEAWRTRESYLDGVPGFLRFALLRGDEANEYISHSIWESRSAFEAWIIRRLSMRKILSCRIFSFRCSVE